MDTSDATLFEKKVAQLNCRLNTYERNQYVLGHRTRYANLDCLQLHFTKCALLCSEAHVGSEKFESVKIDYTSPDDYNSGAQTYA